MINYNLTTKHTGGHEKLKNKLRLLIAAMLATTLLTACGQNTQLTQFHKDMDDFCTTVSELNQSINNIDASADNAVDELLGYLDELDTAFQTFAKLDFPEEFNYLESTAAEASQYMTEAVQSYHDAYSNGSYNEYTAEYAQGNYTRAYKRLQIILSFLHGETPDGIDMSDDN